MKDKVIDVLLLVSVVAVILFFILLLNGCVLIWDTSGAHLRQYTVTEPPKIMMAPQKPDVSSDIDLGIYRGEERL